MANGKIKITFQLPADQIHDRIINLTEMGMDEITDETCKDLDRAQRLAMNSIISCAVTEVFKGLTNIDMVEA